MFPGRYRPGEEDFDRLWDEGIFVLDANVLLNLYRYSDDTREQMIAVLRGLEDRLWLPHQIAREFLNRRLGVIHSKRRAYEELREYLEAARDGIEQRTNQLHRDPVTEAEDALRRVQGSLEELSERLRERETELPKESNSLGEDPIWRTVDELFAGKVGSSYPDGGTKEIFEEGKRRYESRIPPGYKDQNKAREGEQSGSGEEQVYGDLLVWMQILDEAERIKKPVVFVTDDRKEDWWWISHGRTIGPRPELVQEIRERADVPFHMYRPDRFMAEASERNVLDEAVSEEAIGEAEELLSLEEEAQIEETATEPPPAEGARELASAPASPTNLGSPIGGLGTFSPPSLPTGSVGSSPISPVVRQALQELSNPGFQEAVRNLSNPVAQDAMRNLSGPIAQDAIRKLTNPVTQDAIRRLTNPVTQDAMRRLSNPATQDAMRRLASPEVQEYLRRQGPFPR